MTTARWPWTLGCALAALATALAPAVARPDTCERVPIWRDGRHRGAVCRSEAARLGLTVIDLGDSWTPPVLAADRYGEPAYRTTYLALAQERFDDAGDDGVLAKADRYLELYGIEPTLGVVRARLDQTTRHRCHEAIDDTPLASARDAAEHRAAAVRVVQAHLACDGLFAFPPIEGEYTWQTRNALEAFQRGAMILPTGSLDAPTREALALASRERDFRTALRVLRERVAAATGLIEDGTAGSGMATVLGRELEPEATWRARGYGVLAGAAPDLVSPATEAAARALGWRDAASTRAFLDGLAAANTSSRLVALALPAPPAYHRAQMRLSVEIDRGDDTAGRRAALIVYTTAGSARIPLVRWPTTVGGWQAERVGDDEDGAIEQRWKESPAGHRVWRDLFVGPRWLPPSSIPDRELVRAVDEHDVLAREQIGPSYRAAFGMIAFAHVIEAPGRDEDADEGIRTHATGNLVSLATGVSHGCHRLLGAHAMRLADFVLAHRVYARRGDAPVHYHRIVRDRDTVSLTIDSLGYRIELVPPIPVDVLPGQIRR